MTTAALVVMAWFLSHRQSVRNNTEIKEVKNIVNGPLLQSMQETAALARKLANLTGLGSDISTAIEKEKALSDRVNAQKEKP